MKLINVSLAPSAKRRSEGKFFSRPETTAEKLVKEVDMPASGLKAFDTTIEKANIWLKQIMMELNTDDRHRAYLALSAVLHALRDRLPAGEAIDLGAQLPMLIRGLYYEGWDPGCQPIKHDRDSFLQYIRDHFRAEPQLDAECIARSVFKVIARQVDQGEIRDIKGILPKDLRQLWEPSPAQANT